MRHVHHVVVVCTHSACPLTILVLKETGEAILQPDEIAIGASAELATNGSIQRELKESQTCLGCPKPGGSVYPRLWKDRRARGTVFLSSSGVLAVRTKSRGGKAKKETVVYESASLPEMSGSARRCAHRSLQCGVVGLRPASSTKPQ